MCGVSVSDDSLSRSVCDCLFCSGVLTEVIFAGECICRRPYHVENTGSRPITEVKQRWARLVLAWVTGWEYRVLPAFDTPHTHYTTSHTLFAKPTPQHHPTAPHPTATIRHQTLHYTQTFCQSLRLSNTHTQSLSPYLSLSPPPTLSFTRTHTHSHSHTHNDTHTANLER